MDGLRFERRGDGDYYKVILHIGSTYVPISDEDMAALKQSSESPGDQLLDVFLNRVGYSSHLTDQIKAELLKLGERPRQLATLRQSIQAL